MEFLEWSPSGDAAYNPFGRGNPTEIADKALAGHQWSEPHTSLPRSDCSGRLATMRAAGIWPPTPLSDSPLHGAQPARRTRRPGGRRDGGAGRRVRRRVLRASQADLVGGRNRLAVLAEGELGPRLDPGLGDGPAIDFARALRNRQVIYHQIASPRLARRDQAAWRRRSGSHHPDRRPSGGDHPGVRARGRGPGA